MNISQVMENIVSRATLYSRFVTHNTFFTDTSGTIDYVLNSFWHREDELDSFSEGYTLAVGCSHTFGIGVSTPWPCHIHNTYNAGVPGATIYDMIDIAKAMYAEKKFSKLILFAPHGERMLVNHKGVEQALMPYSDVYEDYKNINTKTKMYYNMRSLEFLKLWCKHNDILLQTINLDSITFMKTHKHIIEDKGADNLHYGEKTQKNFSELFYD